MVLTFNLLACTEQWRFLIRGGANGWTTEHAFVVYHVSCSNFYSFASGLLGLVFESGPILGNELLYIRRWTRDLSFFFIGVGLILRRVGFHTQLQA